MGTRGIVGFRIDGKDKVAYNHFDSYPSGVGVVILIEARAIAKDIENVKKCIRKLELVDEKKKPTKEQIKRYEKFSNTLVSRQTKTDWYCLLRDIQGTIMPYAKGEVEHLVEYSDFLKDSLFCEWGYIVNLDTNKLEVWTGYQQIAQKGNRYGEKANEGGYYPCQLIAEFDLKELPTKKEFLKLEKEGD